jgi:hypothetical protein
MHSFVCHAFIHLCKDVHICWIRGFKHLQHDGWRFTSMLGCVSVHGVDVRCFRNVVVPLGTKFLLKRGWHDVRVQPMRLAPDDQWSIAVVHVLLYRWILDMGTDARVPLDIKTL